jgi:ketosteroid isomerase-like protein
MSEENVVTQIVPLKGRNRRTLEERLSVRLPALVRLYARPVMRLSPRSRIRRAAVVRRARQLCEAFNRRDWDFVLLGYTPDVEVITAKDEAAVPFGADIDDVYHGREGMLALWERWLEPWAEYRLEPEQLVDCGDRLIVVFRQRGRGRRSGVELDQQVAHLNTLDSNGLTNRLEIFWDPAKALEAAGAAE